MTEIEKLILAVETRGVTETNRQLDSLDKNAKQAKDSTESLKKSWAAFYVAAAASAVIIYKVGDAVIQATRRYQDFNAQLKTATGSAEAGAQAFKALEKFAADTPYAVGDAVSAYVVLRNRGLDPTIESLRAYGDIASASGKTFQEMIQVITSATAGQYESLRGLGVRVSKSGEDITLSFKGQTTVIKDTDAAWRQYFVTLGQTNFAGAMFDRMKTLGGAISNVADSWETFLQTLGNQGPATLTYQAIQYVDNAIKSLTAAVASGQLAAQFNAIGIAGKAAFGDIGNVAVILLHQIGALSQSVGGLSFEKLLNMPGRAMAGIKMFGSDAAAAIDKGIAGAKYIGKDLAKEYSYNSEIDTIKNTQNLTEIEKQAAIDIANAKYDAVTTANQDSFINSVEFANKTTGLVKSQIVTEQQLREEAIKKELETADRLRAEYEANKATKVLELPKAPPASDQTLGGKDKAIKEAKIKEAKDTTAQILAAEKKLYEERIKAAEDFFGNIASIGSTFGEKGFKIAQAAAIAQATIKTYEAATSAYAALAGIPYIGPALGAAAAGAAIVAGAANIAQIKAQTYTKAYATGGMVPAGKYGLVGEAGPEIVRGPAVVTSAATTRSKNLSSGSNGNVTVHNYGQPVQLETQRNGNDLLLILKPLLAENKEATKRELTGELARGGSQFTQSIEKTYGLRRNAT